MMDSDSKFKIRRMRPDEAWMVHELMIELHDSQAMEVCPRVPTKDDIKEELVSKARNFTSTVVAVDRSREVEGDKAYIIGYAVYSQFYSISWGRLFWLNSFYIQPDFRSLGLGSKMIAYIRAHLLSAGCKSLVIPVMDHNHRGQKFYKRYGAYLVNEDYDMMLMPSFT